MADRYHWTPEQVDALDPDFLDELLVFWDAQSTHHEIQRKREEARARAKAAHKGR